MSEPTEHLNEKWMVEDDAEAGPVIVTENRWYVATATGGLPGDTEGVDTLAYICRLHNEYLKLKGG